MKRYAIPLAVLVIAALVAAAGSFRTPATAPDPTTQPEKTAAQPPAGKAVGVEASIKAITAEYEKAFNTADARAAAALWTEAGEYVGADGEVVAGRVAIEKSLAAHFQAHPKAIAEVRVGSVRVLGRGTATAEGVVRVKVPGDNLVIESRYTALHVLEDGKWHAASVREWVPDPATDVTPNNLEWLIGEWVARGDGGELRITYAWDENKVFLTAKYALAKDGKTVSSGTQVLGRNPAGGVRSWSFDSSGTTSDGVWVRDGSRWLNEVVGVLPDGTKVTSLNVVVPLGPDAFTWQTTDRATDSAPLPALPPVKVTRVKK